MNSNVGRFSPQLRVGIILIMFLWQGSFFPWYIPSAQASRNVMLVIDASGSMQSRLETASKIEAVKNAIPELLRNIKSSSSVGLIVYGSNRKADCDDLELSVPPNNFSDTRKKILEKIHEIKPTGMTPIAKALVYAEREILPEKTDSVILLISDGQDSCLGNPCEIVKQWKNRKINSISVSVIGLNVNSGAERQLRCITEAGAGKFFPVKNQAGLEAAFRSFTAEEPGSAVEKEIPVDKTKDQKKKKVHAKIRFIPTGNRIKNIRVNSTSDREDRIFVAMEKFQPPLVRFEKRNGFKVFCQFPGTRPEKSIPAKMDIQGWFIRHLQMGMSDSGGDYFQIIIDTVPNAEYELQHLMSRKERQYIMVLKRP